MEWKFVNAQCKKKILWLHIGESMSKDGFNVSATDYHRNIEIFFKHIELTKKKG